ncbi:MAG: HAD family hydrolase [Pseudomonadota bacterium]
MRRAAFFDMDRTVLKVNSGTLWMRFLRRRGEITRLQLARAFGWALRYRLSLLDMNSLSRKLVCTIAGRDERQMAENCQAWYLAEIERTIAAPARRAILRHQDRGETVVLLTGATPYVAEPLAASLSLDHVICSRLEVQEGRFTGRVVEPLCFGRGKVTLAERWAASEAIDLATSSFYTDSFNDLPMLERVGEPVVVNPDFRLLRVARRRGWPVCWWDRDREA